MKKLMILLTLAALLLAGCGAQSDPQTTDPQTTTAPQPSIGAGEAVVPEEGDIVIDLSE